MRTGMRRIMKSIIAAAVLTPPSIAGAAFPVPSTVNSLPTPPFATTTDVEGFVRVLLLWLFWGLMVLAVVMFFIGGYRYATSSGDPEKVHSANRMLLFAAIAAAVALIAAGLPFLVASFFGTSLNQL